MQFNFLIFHHESAHKNSHFSESIDLFEYVFATLILRANNVE